MLVHTLWTLFLSLNGMEYHWVVNCLLRWKKRYCMYTATIIMVTWCQQFNHLHKYLRCYYHQGTVISCALIKWHKRAPPWTTQGIKLKRQWVIYASTAKDRQKKEIHCISNEYLLNHWAVVFDASCDEAFQGRSPRQVITYGALQSHTSLKMLHPF